MTDCTTQLLMLSLYFMTLVTSQYNMSCDILIYEKMRFIHRMLELTPNSRSAFMNKICVKYAIQLNILNLEI
jgi:hypothetical protein